MRHSERPAATLPDPWRVPFVSVEEAGRLLHLSRRSAYRAVQAGELPAVSVAGVRRVAVADLYRLRRLPLPERGELEPGPVIVWAGSR